MRQMSGGAVSRQRGSRPRPAQELAGITGSSQKDQAAISCCPPDPAADDAVINRERRKVIGPDDYQTAKRASAIEKEFLTEKR
ncbi:hypothetical protein [Mucilaginibacter sp.]|uniref:hypothetical protein n=1 Tax=Mucilaginibacter sp. TaxID=1882438 RepID=UPI0026140FFC|nr:hypothetical protein [Mucilaginibacter sp.]